MTLTQNVVDVVQKYRTANSWQILAFLHCIFHRPLAVAHNYDDLNCFSNDVP